MATGGEESEALKQGSEVGLRKKGSLTGSEGEGVGSRRGASEPPS